MKRLKISPTLLALRGYVKLYASGDAPMNRKLRQQIEQAAAALIAAGAREVYLFGSAADRPEQEASDIDLAISGLPPEKFFRAMSTAADLLDRPLDLIDLDEDNLFNRHLRKYGKLQRVA